MSIRKPNAYEIVFDTIKRRRTIRRFKKKRVPPNLIEDILDAARFAPSAMNSQPWEFVVVNECNAKRRLMDIYSRARQRLGLYEQDASFIADVTLIVVCVRRVRSSYCFAGALAVQNILLASTALELGSIILGAALHFDDDKEELKRLFCVPEDCEIVAVVGIGYKNERCEPMPRTKLEDIIHYEKF